jgi:hypothetical protein
MIQLQQKVWTLNASDLLSTNGYVQPHLVKIFNRSWLQRKAEMLLPMVRLLISDLSALSGSYGLRDYGP